MTPTIDAGATFNYATTLAQYPADVWTATLYLNPRAGGTVRTVTATADGTRHVFQAAGTITQTWVAGLYGWELWVDRAGERYRVDGGQLEVRATLLAAAAGTDTRTDAQRALDLLRAAWRAYISSGNVTAASYTINGRTMTYRTVAELRAAINAAERDVLNEETAQRAAAGLGGRTRFVIRM